MLPLEAVPNFSEGRDRATIDAIGEALGAHARLLDLHSDADHNRSVYTLVGNEEQLVAALIAGIACARERIDLRSHAGRASAHRSGRRRPARPDPRGRRRARPRRSAGACAAGGGGARASGLPLRRPRTRSRPRLLPAWRPRGAAAANRRRGAGSGLRAGAARRESRRRDRRSTSRADRVQRQPRRRRPRGGARGGACSARARRRLPGSAGARAAAARCGARPGQHEHRGLAGLAAARGRRRGGTRGG